MGILFFSPPERATFERPVAGYHPECNQKLNSVEGALLPGIQPVATCQSTAVAAIPTEGCSIEPVLKYSLLGRNFLTTFQFNHSYQT